MASISIALSKGRIFDETAPLLARAGIRPKADPESSRKLIIGTNRRDVRLVVVRATDTPTYVQHGGADLGIAGRDVLAEHGAEGLYQPVDLGIAACRMMVAVPRGFDYASAVRQGARLRVATKYVNTARATSPPRACMWISSGCYGSMELAPLVGLADAIVDLVSTGRTLKANGLVAVEELMPVSARLIVNQAALKTKRAELQPPHRRFCSSGSPVKLRRLSTRARGFEAKLAALTRYEAAQDPALQKVVRKILADVRRGDAAVRTYTRKFDGVAPGQYAVSDKLLDAIPADQAQALRAAHERIRAFHEKQLQQSWHFTDADGTRLGQQVSPLQRVGLYVPGGKAAYPSSVLMNAVPAKVAGVGELIMASPNPSALVLAAAALAGVDRVLGIGGAQAIAALAYGTQSIPRVDKIVGPGNAYVAEAKRQVFGEVGIDMVAGPSEILIIADASVNPDWIAMDLFSQAEHDESAQAIPFAPTRSISMRSPVPSPS